MEQLALNLPSTIECPCCGQPVEGVKFLADPTTSVIRNAAAQVRLTPQEFRVFEYLLTKFPRLCHKDDIWSHAFMQPNGEGPELKIVDVIICKLRKKLVDVGIVIETTWGKGYKLVEVDPALVDEIKEKGIRLRDKGSALRWHPEYDEQLLDYMKRGFTVSHIAAVMKMPYGTIDRHMKALRPLLADA